MNCWRVDRETEAAAQTSPAEAAAHQGNLRSTLISCYLAGSGGYLRVTNIGAV